MAHTHADTAFNSFMDSLFLGAYPKVSAAVATPIARYMNPELVEREPFETTYRRGRDYLAADIAESQSEHPWTGLAAGFAGSGMPLAGLGKIPGIAKYLNPANPTIAKAAASGAGIGGLYGGLSTNYDNDPMQYLQGVAGHAGIGAGLGAAGQAVLPLAGKVGNSIMNAFTTGKITPEQQHAIELAKRFNVPLELQKVTQSPKDVGRAESLRLGSGGEGAANMLRQSSQNTKQAYRQAAEQLQKDIIPNNVYVEKGQSLLPGAERMVQMNDKKYTAAQNAYDEAAEKVGNLGEGVVENISKLSTDMLKKAVLAPEHRKLLANELDVLKNHTDTEGLSVKSLEEYRKGLNESFRTSTGPERLVYRTLIKSIDETLDNLGSIPGNELAKEAAEGFTKARRLFRQYITEAEAQHKQEKGRKGIQDILENSKSREKLDAIDLSNKFYGRSQYGLGGDAERKLRQEAKRRLGADSPEWQGYRLEGINKVLSPVLNKLGEIDLSGPGIERFRSNLIRERHNLKDIISDKQYKDLKDFGDLGALAFRVEKNYHNLSGTTVLGHLLDLAEKLPVGAGAITKFLRQTDLKGKQDASKFTDFANIENNVKARNKPEFEIEKTPLKNPAETAALVGLSNSRLENPEALKQAEPMKQELDIHPSLRGRSKEELLQMLDEIRSRNQPQ